MNFNPGNFYPVWPEMVGVPIPDTDRKTNLKHALFFGIVANYCNRGSENYCYASTQYFMDLLDLNAKKVSEYRSDLVKLGWIRVEHGDRNKVVKTYAREVSFPKNGETDGGSFPENGETDTSVITPVGTENYINKKHMCSPNAYPEGEGLHSVGSKEEDQRVGQKACATPVGEELFAKGPSKVDVKPRKNPNRFVAPLTMELLGLSGAKVCTPTREARAAVNARLNEGYTVADLKAIVLEAKGDKFFMNLPLSRVLRGDNAEALLKRANRKGGSGLTKQAQNYV